MLVVSATVAYFVKTSLDRTLQRGPKRFHAFAASVLGHGPRGYKRGPGFRALTFEASEISLPGPTKLMTHIGLPGLLLLQRPVL